MLNGRKRLLVIVLPMVVMLGVVPAVLLAGGSDPSVSGSRFLSIEFASRVQAAPEVTNGTGAQMDFSPGPVMRGGGVPVASVSYVDGIHIVFSDPGYEDLHFTRKQLEQWARNKTVAEAEALITAEAQKYLEVWLDMSDFPVDDPAVQDPPVLLDNERLERKQGRDWLVTTVGHFAIHCYNLDFNEGDFITRINGLGAGPIEGDWWL